MIVKGADICYLSFFPATEGIARVSQHSCSKLSNELLVTWMRMLQTTSFQSPMIL